MNLEWFRTHQKFVYLVLTPLVVISFAMLFPMGGAGEAMSSGGPSVQLTLNENKKVVLSPSEVHALRVLLAQFSRASDVSTDQAAAHAAKVYTAQNLGFETGSKELQQNLIDAIKQQVRMREPEAGDVRATEQVYNRLLQNMQMSRAQFERLVRELSTARKLELSSEAPLVDDNKLFADFCREKEVARLRFKTIRSEDYMAQAAEPTAEKVKEFYEKHKSEDAHGAFADMLMSEPKLSADLLFFDPAKLFAGIKATPEDLKSFYDLHKSTYWMKEAPRAGQTPKAGADKFKPFETVKAEVEEKWAADQKRTRAKTHMDVLKKDLEQAESAYKAEQEKKPEAGRKPFDLAAWAKGKGLVHWATPEQTQEVYEKGKKEVNAPDAGWVYERFLLASSMYSNPRFEKIFAKQAAEFSYPAPVKPDKPEAGYVMARIKKYVKPQLKSLDEAKAAIALYLKGQNAIELAKKAAKQLHDDWVDGKNLPQLASLDEVSGDSKNAHPLLKRFFESPMPVGEVLPVAEGPAAAAGGDKPEEHGEQNDHERFYVGFAVERLLPSLATFERDTEYDREAAKRKVATADFYYLNSAFERYIYGKGVFDRTIQAPPLFERH